MLLSGDRGIVGLVPCRQRKRLAATRTQRTPPVGAKIALGQNRIAVRAGKRRRAHRGLSKSPGKRRFGSMISESAYAARGKHRVPGITRCFERTVQEGARVRWPSSLLLCQTCEAVG